MSETVKTVLVKTSAPDNEQGFVAINETDFDAAVHELFVPGEGSEGHDVGTGLTVAQIKEALTAKGITIPTDAKKAELQVLLDAA